jgi:hypothetical protein
MNRRHRRRAVAEHGGHLDGGVLPDERPGLGHGALARIELDLEELQVLALDLEVDVVGDAGVALVAAKGSGAWEVSSCTEHRFSGAAHWSPMKHP